ncbi:MAG TPA: 50S ribosomal protein L25 [Polyangiaceae bacterium]|jgi:large subunit ribosomal protein L25|nr:50S ribosomal protein L25 [Polyangiaceae bacterium]
MDAIKVTASRRDGSGKGAARRLRSEGRIPAVAYGKGLPTQALAIAPEAIKSVLSSARGRNTVVTLDVDGKAGLTVLLSDFQYHPVSRELLHADFLQIHLDQPVNVEVPLELTGKAVGVTAGGTLRQVFRKLPIRCLPGQIPVKLTYDVTELALDGHVPVKDLALPEGVSVRLPPEQTVASVVTEIVRAEEETTPAAGAAAAPGAAAPGAAAPAAGAAAAAPAKAPAKK